MAVEETSGDIYVCKGENGVAKISSNGQVNDNFFTCPTFTKPEKTELAGKVKGRANGIAIGSDYIYVACGGYGLVVLDKETGKTVCHRKANAYKNDDCGSANYVAVENVNGEEYVTLHTVRTVYRYSRLQRLSNQKIQSYKNLFSPTLMLE